MYVIGEPFVNDVIVEDVIIVVNGVAVVVVVDVVVVGLHDFSSYEVSFEDSVMLVGTDAEQSESRKEKLQNIKYLCVLFHNLTMIILYRDQ